MPTTIDPATGAVLREYPWHDASEVEARLARATAEGATWARTPLSERSERLRALASELRSRDEAAELMTAEMGKPIAQARGEIDKCAWLCEHYADHGPAMLADEHVEGTGARSYVAHRPLGTILAIMPWNFPWWQALRFAVPAVLAGNATLIKHAPNTTGSGLAIADSFRRAGFPDGLVAALVVEHEVAGEVIGDRRIAGVTLTGSTRAGRAVGAIAGRHLKKSVLELGGSDPYIVLADADVELAAEVCAAARLHNSGQTCVAAKRFVVCEAVADRFCEALTEQMRAAVVGDPRDGRTTVGPLARVDLRDGLRDQVERSLAAGAVRTLGDAPPEGPAAFFPVTVLDRVEPGTPAATEELFGPVAAILRVRDEAEAVRVANDTDYGLGAVVFSRDLERAEAIARDALDAGCCFVNASVRSDPRLPFGGVKDSGYGRELGRLGLLEWVNSKTVWVAGADG